MATTNPESVISLLHTVVNSGILDASAKCLVRYDEPIAEFSPPFHRANGSDKQQDIINCNLNLVLKYLTPLWANPQYIRPPI